MIAQASTPREAVWYPIHVPIIYRSFRKSSEISAGTQKMFSVYHTTTNNNNKTDNSNNSNNGSSSSTTTTTNNNNNNHYNCNYYHSNTTTTNNNNRYSWKTTFLPRLFPQISEEKRSPCSALLIWGFDYNFTNYNFRQKTLVFRKKPCQRVDIQCVLLTI